VTTHNLAKTRFQTHWIDATEEVPSKKTKTIKSISWSSEVVRFFASLGDVILQLYVGTKNGWSQTSEKEKHFSYRWNIFAKEELGLGAPTTKATYYSSHAQAVDISLITHPLLASFGRKSISKDTYCLLFPSSTCAQPAVGIVQTSLIPLNQSKAAMPFTKCDEN